MSRNMRMIDHSVPVSALLVAGAVLGVPSFAIADITRVDVLGVTDMGSFAGKPYREVQARMEGSTPGGAYSVPVTLALPTEAADHNGFAVVDVINTITIYFDNWALGGQPLPLARTHMGDDFLFGRGNAYVGVVWDKAAVEALDNGAVAKPEDGYTILRDAAALARDPGAHLPGGAKVISLLPQTDVEWGGYGERGDSPDYRVIEIAGVSHIPSTAADFRQKGMPEQNPVGFEPVARAALVNLQEWLGGREPPPSIALELSDAPTENFDGAPVRLAAEDSDGNAKGGLRLPHMPDGTTSGAPLGRYTGFALDRKDENFYFTISGTFEPFPPEKLAELYPDQESYVQKVTAAAHALADARYILPEDAEAYIEAAKRADVGN